MAFVVVAVAVVAATLVAMNKETAVATAAVASGKVATASNNTFQRLEGDGKGEGGTDCSGMEGEGGPCVLLTGCTGFLGPHLLAALLGAAAATVTGLLLH